MGLLSSIFRTEPKPQAKPAAKKGRPRQTAVSSLERSKVNVSPSINRPVKPVSIYIDGEWHEDGHWYVLSYAFDKRHTGWLYNEFYLDSNGQPVCIGTEEHDWWNNGRMVHYRFPRYMEKSKKWLCRSKIRELLAGVQNIYVYGPDIGRMEQEFGLSLKTKYNCYNLLKAYKTLEPGRKTYQLCDLEKEAGIHRETEIYKHGNIAKCHRDWADPKLRRRALLYNKEDSINLLRVKEYLYNKHHVSKADEQKWKL